MEIVEIERELWRIARLRDKAMVLETKVLFVEALVRDFIDKQYEYSMLRNVLRDCYASLGSIKNEREAAEQRVRACVEYSARNRAANKGC